MTNLRKMLTSQHIDSSILQNMKNSVENYQPRSLTDYYNQ